MYVCEGKATRLAELALIFIPTVFIALIARRERDQDYDPNSNIDSLRKVSSSNCLKNPLRG